MNLAQLAEMEGNILREIQDLPWDARCKPGPRHEPLFQKYREIHKAYASLASKDIEALKRGLFIQWYALTEPPALSGISGLDPESIRAVAVALNARLETGDTDEELIWMLSHYIGVADFTFDQFKDLGHLANFVSTYTETIYPASIDREAMKCRGGMGMYFNSLPTFSHGINW